jgi:hypothetical protein
VIAERIAEAIRSAQRCEAYTEALVPCDGLDGCEDCLQSAADAVLDLFKQAAEKSTPSGSRTRKPVKGSRV